jgi:hypothetical protein
MKNRLAKYLLPVLCLLVSGCASQYLTKHKSDREMIGNFQTHKVEFSKLLAMFQADKGLLYFSNGRTRPEDPQSVGVTPQRLKEYEVMFSNLGIDGMGDLSQSGAKDEVWFFTSIKGPRESTFKHYAFVAQPAKGIVQDLDQSASKSAPYRLIEDRWYLALDDAD